MGGKISKEDLPLLRGIQLFPLLPIAIYILIVVILYTQVGAPMFDSSFGIILATVIIGIIGVTTLVLIYYLPQWIINLYKKKSQSPPGFTIIGILRSACFIFVAICGLVIAILSTWIVAMLLFVGIVITMILTFPYEEKLNRMLD